MSRTGPGGRRLGVAGSRDRGVTGAGGDSASGSGRVGVGDTDVYISWMDLDTLLAASRATEEFKAAVRQYSTMGKAPLIEVAGFSPPTKVLRVVAQLLDSESGLSLERVRVAGNSGCSDFRGVVDAHAEGVVRQWSFVWCCKWRAIEQGWVDWFGLPDQMRAAREFGYRCFQTWVPVLS